MTTTRFGTTARQTAAAVLATGLLFAGAGCGGDDDDTAGAEAEAGAETDGSASEAPGSDDTGGGPLTVETVADTCDMFTDAITELRGEAPETVEPNPVTDVTDNGQTYRSAECLYLYAGDEFTDQNRLSIQVNHAEDMTPAQREQMWDTLAVTEAVTGVGDEAHWYYSATVDVAASARALTGDTVVILRATVPSDIEGAPWIAQEPMVATLQDVLTTMSG
jgi:hypothetical protein